MMNIKRYTLNVLAAGLLILPLTAFAADTSDVEELEKRLIQKETELLEPELKLDRLYVERSKLDGFGGVFQGSKKKALEKQIAETSDTVKSTYSEMKSLQKQVQEMVFNVASTLEKNGEYRKAIEYYLKIDQQDDMIRGRIAGCYKALKEYEQAIQWLLRMARSDENLLEVADCYRLDTRMKDAFYWLFKIVEPIDGNAAELTALAQLESWNYPQKSVDYPDFTQRLSDVYLSKAVLNVQTDFNGAKADYIKATMLLAGTGDPKAASFAIVSRTQSQHNVAIDMLNQQREAAERNYENMLREAKSEYDRSESRYRQAQYEGEQEYQRRVDYSRRELERAEHELRNLQSQASPSAQLIDQARRTVDESRRRYDYTMRNRTQIVDEYVAPYRRDMDRAMDRYHDIMNRRSLIIDEYIAPYKRQVEMARRRLDVINNLHQAAYGY